VEVKTKNSPVNEFSVASIKWSAKSIETLLRTHPRTIALSVLFLFGVGPKAFLATGANNMYVLEAASFLDGRLDLDHAVQDASIYGGKIYAAFPPLPAALLTPFVAVLGQDLNSPLLLGLLLTLLSAWLMHRTLRRLPDVSSEAADWLTAGFVLGTGLWMVTAWATGVWYTAHVTAVFCCTACVAELHARRRAWLLGLCVGGAFLSRQMTIFYAPLVLWCLARDTDSDPARIRRLLTFTAPLLVAVALQLWFNAARFSGPFDTGYAHMVKLDEATRLRLEQFGLFSPHYFVSNLISTYLQGPHVEMTWPQGVVMGFDPHGTALTFASPFVLLALKSRARIPGAVVAWMCVAAIALIHLFYYNDGFYQINCARFTLDYLPIVMVFAAAGWGRVPRTLARGLVAYSVALNVIALIVVVKFVAKG
jgi:hypothetical protein